MDLGSSGIKWKDLHLAGDILVDGKVDGVDVAALKTQSDLKVDGPGSATDATMVVFDGSGGKLIKEAKAITVGLDVDGGQLRWDSTKVGDTGVSINFDTIDFNTKTGIVFNKDGNGNYVRFNMYNNANALPTGQYFRMGFPGTDLGMTITNDGVVHPINHNTMDLGSSGIKWKHLHLAGDILVDGKVDGVDVAALKTQSDLKVDGPGSATDWKMAVFDGASGKLIKEASALTVSDNTDGGKLRWDSTKVGDTGVSIQFGTPVGAENTGLIYNVDELGSYSRFCMYNHANAVSGSRYFQSDFRGTSYGTRINNSGSFTPVVTSTMDLGVTNFKWKDLHLSGNITVDGLVDGVDVAALKTQSDLKVDGPGSATADNLCSFNGSGGKLIKDSGISYASTSKAFTIDGAAVTFKYVRVGDMVTVHNDSDWSPLFGGSNAITATNEIPAGYAPATDISCLVYAAATTNYAYVRMKSNGDITYTRPSGNWTDEDYVFRSAWSYTLL
jgi:hypothetical protein